MDFKWMSLYKVVMWGPGSSYPSPYASVSKFHQPWAALNTGMRQQQGKHKPALWHK